MRYVVGIGLLVLVCSVDTTCADEGPRDGIPVDPASLVPAGPHYRVEPRIEIPQSVPISPMTVLPGVTVSVNELEETPFLQDVDVSRSGGRFVSDPIVGTLLNGFSFELACAPVPGNADASWVAFRSTSVALKKPPRRFPVRTSRAGRATSIQLPQSFVRKTAGVRRVRHGVETFIAAVHRPGVGPVRCFAKITPIGDVRGVPWDPPASSGNVEQDFEPPTLGTEHQDVPVAALLRRAVASQAAPQRIALQFVRTWRTNWPRRGAIPRAQAERLLRGCSRPLQRAVLSSATIEGTASAALDQQSYVQDYDAAGTTMFVKTPHGQTERSREGLYDPKIGSIQAGLSTALKVVDGRRVIDVIWAQVVRPIQTFDLELARGPRVTIELPELRLQHVQIDLVTGHVKTLVGGASQHPAPKEPIDWKAGRVFVPFGKTVVRGRGGDRIQGLGVWIDIREAR